jgi:molecular chaperone GrpE
LAEILASEGLERIATVGEAFNPLVHNGIATESDPDKNEDVVTEEFLAGYRLKDKVIRPALVKVNKNSCRPVCSGC